MPGFKETNVRLPVCAHQALAVIAARQGTSRDATVRLLLSAHVQAQEEVDPDDRLTHISTLLRYPPPPLWRTAPRQGRPLRLRADGDLLERARALALRLPGQHQRAYRDYQGRMLTDAVMTAIAVAEPFGDDFLEGLLPVLRQRAALGLWRLVTAETSTGPEKEYLVAAAAWQADRWGAVSPVNDGDQYLLRVAETLEQEEGWHSSERFKRAAHLARRHLTGPGARIGEQWLYEQGEDFRDTYQDRLQADDGLAKHAKRGYDWTGRGGSAVWRAERRIDLECFEDWMVGRTKGDPVSVRESRTPGWLLRTPVDWHALAFPCTTAGELPEPYARWTGEGRVLVFPHRSGQALWPLCRRRDGGPVPGAEPLVAAAAGLPPQKVLAFIEAALIEWDHVFEEEPAPYIVLDLPVDKAHRFGFITAGQQHDAMAEARAATLTRMDAFIGHLESNGATHAYKLEQLREARGNVRAFHRLARSYGRDGWLRFEPVHASWRWPKGSVVSEVLAGTPPEVVQWLAGQAYRQSSLLLELSMQHAWRRAFDRFGFRM
ncbi:hypothetical protein ACIA98_42510 [Streptomyces sp. NPDC051366]|uniref:hypothetical protein n=1 Tax=Streptomyces sp. NPDC051366 TaxID=3365652 RepID=UPI0037953D5D